MARQTDNCTTNLTQKSPFAGVCVCVCVCVCMYVYIYKHQQLYIQTTLKTSLKMALYMSQNM
jgi:hypothetical protein